MKNYLLRALAASVAFSALLATAQASTTELEITPSSDWGSGFTANASFTNNTGSALNGWTLEFDFTHQITSIWNAEIVSRDGDHYVVGNASWNGSVAAGASVQFGFNGSPGSPPTTLSATLSGPGGDDGSSGGGDDGGSDNGSGDDNGSGSADGILSAISTQAAPRFR